MAKTVNLLKVYRQELVETLNKNDFELFKNHCKRWSNYLPPLQNEQVLKVSFYKTMYNEKNVYPKYRKLAKQWLIDNGFNPRIE